MSNTILSYCNHQERDESRTFMQLRLFRCQKISEMTCAESSCDQQSVKQPAAAVTARNAAGSNS